MIYRSHRGVESLHNGKFLCEGLGNSDAKIGRGRENGKCFKINEFLDKIAAV
jgi:hypothetical protein